MENGLAGGDFILMAKFFLPQELISFPFGPLETLISRVEPLTIFLTMIPNKLARALSKVFRFLLLGVVFVEYLFTLPCQFVVNNFLKFAIVSLLKIELILALLLDLLEGTIVNIFFALELSIKIGKFRS